MKILLVHRSLYLDGGDTKYTIDLTKLLTSRGHEVVIFNHGDGRNADLGVRVINAQDGRNNPGPSKFGDLELAQKLMYGASSAFSLRAYRRMRSLLRSEHFDIVHIQSIHHTVTTSILLAIKDAGVPVVWTLHDYRLICPESHLVRNGASCTLCVKGSLIHAITNKCKRGSYFLSTGAVLASLVDRVTRCYDIPARFIAPSMAVQRMFVSAGFDESRFSIVHHFVEVPSRPPSKVPEEGILYFGRFAREKGIGVLLRTAEILKNLEFILVGDGEMRQDIEEFCLSEHSRNVAMHPFTTGPQLEELILKAQLVVCPSQWEEVFGLTILESMALGKMVIASATGAIPEIIDDGENGFLVKQVTEPTEWARCITDVLKDPSRHSRIKLNAIETVRSRFSKDAHYVKLMAVYNSVVSPEGAIPG